MPIANLKLKASPVRFLGIDPGYERVGIAIVEKNSLGKDTLLYSDCFQTDKKLSHPERLLLIAQKLRQVIAEFNPTIMGVEKLYFSGNQKTAMAVSEARGVILLSGSESGMAICEYTPPEIKMAIAGYGKADKKQIITMVKMLVAVPVGKHFDDEFDAIACALTASACYRVPLNPHRG
jgi:crossover junction endodeoxyribonuclease RuvC